MSLQCSPWLRTQLPSIGNNNDATPDRRQRTNQHPKNDNSAKNMRLKKKKFTITARSGVKNKFEIRQRTRAHPPCSRYDIVLARVMILLTLFFLFWSPTVFVHRVICIRIGLFTYLYVRTVLAISPSVFLPSLATSFPISVITCYLSIIQTV